MYRPTENKALGIGRRRHDERATRQAELEGRTLDAWERIYEAWVSHGERGRNPVPPAVMKVLRNRGRIR